MDTARPVSWREHRGYTILEMAVVMVIIAILAASLFGGYVNMQKNQRLSNSAEKVMAGLHLARSLAITNNAIYHIRIQDYEVVSATSNPVLAKHQSIAVYCYPKASDALEVVTEPHPTQPSTTGRYHWWSQYRTLKNPVGQPYTNPYLPGANVPLDNYCVDSVKLEPKTYFGAQNPVRDVYQGVVLSFSPDGTASENVTFFVTDDECKLTDDASQTFAGFDDKSKDVAARQHVADIRWRAFRAESAAGNKSYGETARLRMIRVLRGGIVKLLDPKNAEDRLP